MALWIARLKVTLERGVYNHKLHCFGSANSEDESIERLSDFFFFFQFGLESF